MKVNHENIQLIENWLDQNNFDVEINDDFVRKVYDEVLEHLYIIKDKESIKKRNRAYTLQYEFVRRDLLKILYKRNNFSAKGIKEGYVYAIGNPAWKDYVKVGSAIDVLDRLNSYQTSSPHRDYYIIDYFCTYNRLEYEKKLHSMFERNSEWCKVSEEEIKIVFKHLKADNAIKVLDDKLYAVKRKIEEELREKEQTRIKKKEEKNKLRKGFISSKKIRVMRHTSLGA